MSRRQAPKRRVVDIQRVGHYGDVWWEHWLECGHLEMRKRKAPADKIGCGTCSAERQGAVQINEEATAMAYSSDLRARLAEFLEVPQDAVYVDVRVVGGYPKVQSASVQLNAKQVRNLVNR